MAPEESSRLSHRGAFAKALGEALGISVERVVRIEIAVGADSLPQLKVTSVITERQAGLLQQMLKESQFELVPKDGAKQAMKATDWDRLEGLPIRVSGSTEQCR